MRSSSSTEDEEDESEAVQMGPWHTTLLEAYKLDGSFLWRVALGPNVPVGNLTSFAVYDFDGDGKCEIAVRTAEGTVFGDGTEIKIRMGMVKSIIVSKARLIFMADRNFCRYWMV